MGKKMKLTLPDPENERRELTVLSRRNISKRKNFWINRIIKLLKLKNFDLPSLINMSIRDLRSLAECLERFKQITLKDARDTILESEDIPAVEQVKPVPKAKSEEPIQSEGFKTFKGAIHGEKAGDGIATRTHLKCAEKENLIVLGETNAKI